MSPDPQRPLIAVETAAERLGISRRLLWSLYNRGDIPIVRIGRAVRFDPSDLDAWIRANKSRGPRDVCRRAP